jgi:hypothetical protein
MYFQKPGQKIPITTRQCQPVLYQQKKKAASLFLFYLSETLTPANNVSFNDLHQGRVAGERSQG